MTKPTHRPRGRVGRNCTGADPYAAVGHRAGARVELPHVDVHPPTFFSHRICLDSEWGPAVYATTAVGQGGAWRLGS